MPETKSFGASDPMEAAYFGLHLWAQAIEASDYTDAEAERVLIDSDSDWRSFGHWQRRFRVARYMRWLYFKFSERWR